MTEQHHVEEIQRLAQLVRDLGGDPEPGAVQPHWLNRPIPEDLEALGFTWRAGCHFGSLIRHGEAFRQTAHDRLQAALEREEFCLVVGCTDQPGVMLKIVRDLQARNTEMFSELAEICKALGCVDKPGVPLRFVQQLIEANSNHVRRQVELLRTWDKANPTERQELDRMRRGWGPSSPTERVRRQIDVAGCVAAIEGAMREFELTEEQAEQVPQDAQDYLAAAYEILDRYHTAILAVQNAIQADPAEWPDIKAAEERGAMQALAQPLPAQIEQTAEILDHAAHKLEEQANGIGDGPISVEIRRRAGVHREIARIMRDRALAAPETEPGRVAFEARHPEPREVEWDEMDLQQRNMWVRVEIAVRHGPEAVTGR